VVLEGQQKEHRPVKIFAPIMTNGSVIGYLTLLEVTLEKKCG